MNISDKKIIKQKTIALSIKDIWIKWSTHEGLKTFFGTDNKIELMPKGAFEIYFLMQSPVGFRGSEGCEILAFIPERMLSFTWNVPPQFEELRRLGALQWVVVEFESITANSTKIQLTHLGWPQEEKWDIVIEYFDKAWNFVLDNLEKTAIQ